MRILRSREVKLWVQVHKELVLVLGEGHIPPNSQVMFHFEIIGQSSSLSLKIAELEANN